MRLSVEQIAHVAGARIVAGDPAKIVCGVAEIDAAGATDLVFAEH